MNKDIEITIEIPVIVNVDYTPAENNSQSGEMLEVCGRRVRGPRLEPDWPEEIDVCGVRPDGAETWDKLIMLNLPNDEDLMDELREE